MKRQIAFAPGAIEGPYRSARSRWLRSLLRRAVWLSAASFTVFAIAGLVTGWSGGGQ